MHTHETYCPIDSVFVHAFIYRLDVCFITNHSFSLVPYPSPSPRPSPHPLIPFPQASGDGDEDMVISLSVPTLSKSVASPTTTITSSANIKPSYTPSSVTHTWAQSEATLILLFHCKHVLRDNVHVEVAPDALHINISLPSNALYRFLLRPHAGLSPPADIDVQSDAVRICLTKVVAAMWPSLGHVVLEHTAMAGDRDTCTIDAPTPLTPTPSLSAISAALRAVLVERRLLTHDTAVFIFFIGEKGLSLGPPGNHVSIGAQIDGAMAYRNYTPVPPLFPVLLPHTNVCVLVYVSVIASIWESESERNKE